MPSTSIAMAASLFYLSRYVSGLRRSASAFIGLPMTQFANHQRQATKFMSTISPQQILDTEQPSTTIPIEKEEPFKVNLLTLPLPELTTLLTFWGCFPDFLY